MCQSIKTKSGDADAYKWCIKSEKGQWLLITKSNFRKKQRSTYRENENAWAKDIERAEEREGREREAGSGSERTKCLPHTHTDTKHNTIASETNQKL